MPVEHLCHGCGAAVDDSAPFCPGCGVPQIRFSARATASDVVAARASAPVVADGPSSFPSSSGPPAVLSHPTYNQVESGVAGRLRAGKHDRRAELRFALNAGAIAAVVVSLIPVALFLVAPLAGYFGVRLYQRRGGMAEPSGRAGFKFGALVGLFASPIFAVLRVAQIVAFGQQGELRKTVIERFQQAAANSPDPQAHQVADYFASPQGMAILIILSLAFICLAFVLLAGMGGAISASTVRRRN